MRNSLGLFSLLSFSFLPSFLPSNLVKLPPIDQIYQDNREQRNLSNVACKRKIRNGSGSKQAYGKDRRLLCFHKNTFRSVSLVLDIPG